MDFPIGFSWRILNTSWRPHTVCQTFASVGGSRRRASSERWKMPGGMAAKRSPGFLAGRVVGWLFRMRRGFGWMRLLELLCPTSHTTRIA